jgi:hypothetical protein
MFEIVESCISKLLVVLDGGESKRPDRCRAGVPGCSNPKNEQYTAILVLLTQYDFQRNSPIISRLFSGERARK